MGWLIVDRVVTLLTLVMLVLMVTVIFTADRSSKDAIDFKEQLANYKLENQNTRINNIAYIEKRIGKLQEQQDTYQILVDRRLQIMENQIKLAVDNNKVNQKVINTNINNNAVGNLSLH